MKSMKLIGLTGGMGCGLTTVAGFFKQLGAEVISADEVARDLTKPDAEGWRLIREVFGGGYFFPNQELDRRKLGRLVFDQPAELKKLNACLHPLIVSEIKKRVAAWETDSGVVIIEAPLLIEVGLDGIVDELVVVGAPLATRLERLVKRDQVERAEIKKRVDAQMPLTRKTAMADTVIKNTKSINILKEEVEKKWQEWQETEQQ